MGRNRVAVVTGAARGIGKAIARRLAAAEDLVVIVDLDGAAVDRAATEIRSEYDNTVAVAADVSDYGRMEGLMGRIHREHGAIDILVNNAGIIRRGNLLSVTEKDWDDIIAVNLKGTFNCCKHAAPFMIA